MAGSFIKNSGVLAILIMGLANSPFEASDQMISIRQVSTEEQALKIAPLYKVYYKRADVDEKEFMERWRLASRNTNYHLLAAYHSGHGEPQGFMDFSIIPSIYWQPAIARIDSVYITDPSLEKTIAAALFDQAFATMKKLSVSKLVAVSCTNYEQEVRVLANHLQLDNDPSKTHFIQMMNK